MPNKNLPHLFCVLVILSISGIFPAYPTADVLPDVSEPPQPNLASSYDDRTQKDQPGKTCNQPETELASEIPTSVAPQSTGGPDSYGYTWSDTVTFNWIDASSGTNTGLTEADDDVVGPINIGFNFEYYENTYSQLYISTNGVISFGEGVWEFSNQEIPKPSSPNNLIAIFWDDLCANYADYNSGAVYYRRGGTTPNRYLVIEWYEISRLYYSDRLTFQVILFENGDILMQYLSLNGDLTSTTVGIEDAIGSDGLQYLHNYSGLSNNKAIRFYRPAPSARVKVWPRYYGQFTNSWEPISFQIPIRNTGELGADTFDITVSSAWVVALYAQDGATPLTDTNANGVVDTGSISQGGSTTIVAKIHSPGSLAIGDYDTVTVTTRSSLDSSKSSYAMLRTAVAAPFVQVYQDNFDSTMSLYMIQPAAQVNYKNLDPNQNRNNPAIAETLDGFIYMWDEYRDGSSQPTYEIKFSLVDRYGQTIRNERKLTDNGSSAMRIYDRNPTVAGSPDGRIGVVWSRYIYNPSDYGTLYNIYFAILDSAGNIVLPPTNLTNNTVWGYG